MMSLVVLSQYELRSRLRILFPLSFLSTFSFDLESNIRRGKNLPEQSELRTYPLI